MVCPHCGTENREEAKFCAQCGAQLVAELEEVERQETEATPKELESVEAEVVAEVPTVEETKPPEPLPEGALLFQRRYEILSFVGHSQWLERIRSNRNRTEEAMSRLPDIERIR